MSRREIQRMRRRLEELEKIVSDQRYRWAQDWPGGVLIGEEEISEVTKARIDTARMLKHAVVVVTKDNIARFYALDLPR